MAESVPVRCPACRRSHRYTAPSYPCACGAPVTAPLDLDGVPDLVGHRAWDEEWITVRCGQCGLPGQWPRPELGCACGTVLRIPVTGPPPLPGKPAVRATTDPVTAAVRHLRRLGHEDVRRTGRHSPSGTGLVGRGILAQVEPSARPTTARDVECLWLAAMTESAGCLYFSVAGYDGEARARADTLDVPLFLLDPAGRARAVNGPADRA
ncbi:MULTISPECIES: hypothetical protein [Streptomyces]|uniref:Restriction endonuclease n=1 Tax=Streptomyces edwardsiae TaxID=3075527 RepID=A0ABU2Q3R8_9ACTN|nr:hypothetical protein [Streptomyces sp. DSM 41636]MDT0399039.1 hypothetical protein [Streptomyces sp. DSM 41636]